MKRSIKTIIVAVIALIVLVGGYFAAVYLIPDKEEDKKTEKTVVSTYLSDVSKDEIDYVKFHTAEGNYTIRNGNPPSIEGYSSHIIDSDKLTKAIYEFNGIAVSREIKKNADNLADYGLDKEDSYVLVKLKDDSEKKIIIGNTTNFEGEYYVRMADSKTVYSISADTAAKLIINPENFRKFVVCEIDNYSISEFSIKNNGAEILSVAYDPDKGAINSYNSFTYVMSYPYNNITADLDAISMLFDAVSSVYADSIVEEDPTNLSQYGLDKPYEIYLKDQYTDVTVKMGDYADDGSVYVMCDDIPVVYKAHCSFYETIKNIKPDDYVSRYIHLINIDKLQKVEIKANDKLHTMSVSRKSEKNVEYTVDGKIKVHDNFTPLYTKVIGISATEISSAEVSGNEKCRITFTLTDGSVKTFIYYEYDSQRYIVNNEGGIGCLVLKKDIEDMLASF